MYSDRHGYCITLHLLGRDLLFDRVSTAPVAGAKLPDIVTVDPWDGKDGEYPEEDYGDLDDIELEPLEDLKNDEL